MSTHHSRGDSKQDRIAAYGAIVHVGGKIYGEAHAACDKRAEESGALLVHLYDSPATIAGQATVGRELQTQAPELDTVIVAVGGGGLSAGIAAAYNGTVRIVTVEPETSRCLQAALDAGEPVDVSVSGVAADSLGSSRVGAAPWQILSQLVDAAVTVADSAIVDARQRLWDELRVVAEPGGAAALAALTSGAYAPQTEERVAVIICGSNTDPSDLI